MLWLAVVGWSLWAANSPGMGSDATRVTYSGIVDERRFYSQATGHAHPLTAADYLDYPRMRAVLVAINNTPTVRCCCRRATTTCGTSCPRYRRRRTAAGASTEGRNRAAHSVFHQPGHARHERRPRRPGHRPDRPGQSVGRAHRALEDGRIGHDKNLFPDWAVAEGPFLKKHPYIPPYLDEGWITQAEAALECPATESMLTSVRGPMGARRFLSNVLHAYEFTKYRIDRVPQYELHPLRSGDPAAVGARLTLACRQRGPDLGDLSAGRIFCFGNAAPTSRR